MTTFLTGFLLVSWRLYWLGIPLILLGFIAMVTSAGGLSWGRRKGLFKSFSELINSHERIHFQGIAWIERLSLSFILGGLLFSAGLTLDMLIPTGHPNYPIKILGKEQRSGGRSGPQYFIKIAGWKSPKKRIEIRRSQIEWQRVDVGGAYRMQTRKGLLSGERLLRLKLDLEAMERGS